MNPQLTNQEWAEVRIALIFAKKAFKEGGVQHERIDKILTELYRVI